MSDDRVWFITQQRTRGRVTLTSSTPASHGRAESNVADGASVAEAEVFAAALEKAGHPAGTNVGQLFLDRGFQEAENFPKEIADDLMEKVRDGHHDGMRYTHNPRRWFATEDLSLHLTLTRTGMFPLYCFALAEDRIARPDSLLVDSRLWKNGTFVPVVPTFSVAYLEIMKLRLEANGSHLARLLDGQQHELVELFEDGYAWSQPDVDADVEPDGMRI